MKKINENMACIGKKKDIPILNAGILNKPMIMKEITKNTNITVNPFTMF
jgi:hypothetical protein